MSCALCLKDKKLCESHIYPEFLYDRIYDEDHTYKVVTTNEDGRVGTRPKGIYEELLCEDCEGLLSRWETYAAELLFQKAKMTERNGQFVAHDVNYTEFKLFQLSLLWRTAVSSRKEIPDIDLGPHEEAMRKMLLSSTPGPPPKYGCMMFFVPDQTEMLSGGLFPPDLVKVDGHHCYRCIFGGVFWVYFVSSHTSGIPYEKVMLTEDGRLPITNAGELGLSYLVDLADDFRSSNPDLFNLD
jgi:hypothetical protein